MANFLAFVLAGGRGERLDPLTRDRAKPAVPFGGRYRLIDFVLSNLANSDILKIKVLTQYKSESLNSHVARGWHISSILGNYVETVPAQMRTGPDWFKGSADAVYQNLNLITDEQPDFVFVFGADHVYRMNVRQMLRFHRETGADCTVAAIPVPLAQGSQFGVIEVDANWRMIGFEEKPPAPKPMPTDPTHCLASMGNYVFSTEALINEIVRDAKRPESAHDFGKSIISEMYKFEKVYVYDFADNRIRGQSEKERGYWRDVGTIDAYYQSNMDLVAVEPIFNLYNDQWPIYTAQTTAPPAKFVFRERDSGRIGFATDSLVCEGVIISGGNVHHSIISPRVRVNSYSYVEDSILFEGVNIGRRVKVRRAIIDKDVVVPPGVSIGYDAEEDRRRGFHVTESGVVVLPKGIKLEKRAEPAPG